ncbi:MAG: DUF3488 domain-containing protein, partial [Planctomycetes bacterium]|nr:DUF3488 domain-containing protein [Planctomycetota bacterium]
MPLRPFTPAEIRTGRRHLETALFTTVLLASATFALAEGHWLLLLLTAVPVAGHVIAARRHVEIYAFRPILNSGVLAIGLLLLVRYLRVREDPLVALGHYVMLIQVCKLFDRKRDRDYIQMLVMSLLLVLAAGMMCQSLLFALLGLAYLVCLAYTAMVFTVKRNLELALRAGPDGAAAPAGPAERPWAHRAVLLRLGVVFAASLATGVVVFLVMPRSRASAAAPLLRNRRRAAVSGFAETVRLGEPSSIYLSDRVVMHV